ncbi:MAG: exodeoxyribonuclease III [Ilumatobacteraceae bacterium]
MRFATWNVNSLKARLERVEAWLADVQPDVLCMQETKLADDAFPSLTFAALGYESVHHGQGQWNGVAILSRVGLSEVVANFAPGAGPPDPDARIITATLRRACWSPTCTCPTGGRWTTPHYEYKLAWLDQLHRHVGELTTADDDVIVAGDFNIAPADIDVYDPAKFVGATHTSPAERERLAALERLGSHGRVSPAPSRRPVVQLVGLPRR